jgi:hypothetical protein
MRLVNPALWAMILGCWVLIGSCVKPLLGQEPNDPNQPAPPPVCRFASEADNPWRAGLEACGCTRVEPDWCGCRVEDMAYVQRIRRRLAGLP